MNLDNSDFANPREIEQKQPVQERLEQTLSFASVTSDRAERRQTTETPQRIEAAKRFDSQLKAFADDTTVTSDNLKAFQAIVKDFNNAADKGQALRQIAPSYLRWDVNMGKQGHEIAGNLDAEKAEAQNANPSRAGLDSNYGAALDVFFNKVATMPMVQRDKIDTALDPKDGETREQRNDKVRAAIGDDKGTLAKFEAMETAFAAVDAVKSPAEKDLEAQLLTHMKEIQKAKSVWRIINQRATIKF